MTMSELMEWLGVSRSTVDGWRKDGRCPKFAKLPSGGLRTRRSDWETYLDGLVAA
jgi:predicted DNA-binding transcriptional regulator AlpA